MSRRNKLLDAPPFPVEQAMKRLGANLKVARIRRDMTIADAAERIGTGPRAVMDAEKGSPATGLVVYSALLWLYDQLQTLNEVANPANDSEGLVLESARKRVRVRKNNGLDREF